MSAPPETVTWWLYLLACKDGRTYAGVALDVVARFHVHASGKGSKFTRANPPLAVLGARSFATKSEALQAEAALKRLKRPAKMQWAIQWPFNAHRLAVAAGAAVAGGSRPG